MKVINHIGLSSGKDSTALWGWAIHDSGYPIESIRGSFCDTENEYQEVYDQITALDEYGKKHGVAPIATLKSEGFLKLAQRKKRFPSACCRFCTQKLKIEPTHEHIKSFQALGYEVIAHSGVRADESTERSLLSEWSEDPVLGCKIRRPLLKKTLEDIWNLHAIYGLPINPLYQRGRKRVGCRLCCMSNKMDVYLTQKHNPEVIEEYDSWEHMVGSVYEANDNEPFSGFFRATTVPEHLRSKTWTNKKGEVFKVCTIQDVVKWSKTLRGGKQTGFDFMFEEDDANEPCKMGYCE